MSEAKCLNPACNYMTDFEFCLKCGKSQSYMALEAERDRLKAEVTQLKKDCDWHRDYPNSWAGCAMKQPVPKRECICGARDLGEGIQRVRLDCPIHGEKRDCECGCHLKGYSDHTCCTQPQRDEVSWTAGMPNEPKPPIEPYRDEVEEKIHSLKMAAYTSSPSYNSKEMEAYERDLRELVRLARESK